MINIPDVGSLLIKALFNSVPPAASAQTDKQAPSGKTTASDAPPQKVDVSAKFTSGEMIEGTVTKSLGPNSTIIRMKGTDMVASTPVPLSEGSQILVRVDQTSPQFMVSLLPNSTPVEEKTAALLRMYLPAESPIASVINELNNLVPLLSPSVIKGSGLDKVMAEITTSAKNPDAKSANPVQLTGVFHEWELLQGKPGNNLKKSLLIVRKNLEKISAKSGGGNMDQLKKVNDAINNIELRQLMAISQKGDMKGWQIPYWNGEKLDSGMLFIGRGDKENNRQKRDGAVRMTVMVKMSNLGEVRADAITFKDRIEGIIYAGSDAAVRALEAGMAGLSKAMSDAGLSARFTVQRASKDFLTRDTREENNLPVKSLLNVRV
ncbi:MAG: flagellar hook-length control protein FliK [Nitrospinae bacterium]|nr:flagellar hook-length control protein FliK [Nitrospinota bacterium]